MRRFLGFFLLCLCLPPAPAGAADKDKSAAIAAHFKNADIFLDDGKPPEAIMELQAAGRLLDPKNPAMIRFHERMGSIYLAQEDLPEAKEHLAKGMELAAKLGLRGPIPANLFFAYGLALVKESRFADAEGYWRKALEMGPTPEQARRIKAKFARYTGAAPEDLSAPAAPSKTAITRIAFVGNRAKEWVLRKRLPFKEGDVLGVASLRAARRALLDMGEFKDVTVSSRSTGGGVEVDILAAEGWPVTFIPGYLDGSGGSRMAMSVLGRDLLGFGETAWASAMGGKAGIRAGGGARWEGYTFDVYEEHHFFNENAYADGGFSHTAELGDPPDSHGRLKFGTIIGVYRKDINVGGFKVMGPLALSDYIGFDPKAGFGWDYVFVRYNQFFGGLPGGGGFLSKAYGELRAGSDRVLAASGLAGPFSFDEAAENRRLKYEVDPRFETGVALRADTAHWWTDSSLRYTYGSARWNSSLTWGRQERLVFSLAGGHGYSLPPPELFATGEATGLYGRYAREFRGTSAVGGSLSFSHPIWDSRWGVLQGTVFAEGAVVYQIDVSQNKKGLGAGLSYRFWDYPAPLSFFYTYCPDDRDSQIYLSVAGRF